MRCGKLSMHTRKLWEHSTVKIKKLLSLPLCTMHTRTFIHMLHEIGDDYILNFASQSTAAFDRHILGFGTEQQTLHPAQITAVWSCEPKINIIKGPLPLSVAFGPSHSQHALSFTVVLFSLSSPAIALLQNMPGLRSLASIKSKWQCALRQQPLQATEQQIQCRLMLNGTLLPTSTQSGM